MTESLPMSSRDRLEVIDLISSYAQHLDLAAREDFVALFAPTAVVKIGNGSRYEGQTAVGQWFDTMLAGGRIGAEAKARHFMGLPVVRGDGKRCTAHTYIAHFGLDAANTRVELHFVASYADRCVKLDGRWYFEERVIYHDLEGSSH
jgi:hypothetical protein